MIDLVKQYLSAGFSVIPIRADGSKAPVRAWSQFQRRRADEGELKNLFPEGCGVAIVCGQISGGVEVFDFDAPHSFDLFMEDLEASGGHLEGWPIVKTPKGFGRHIYVRRVAAGEGRKLARNEVGETIIEIRGEGNYVLAPGCPPECHPTQERYVELDVPVQHIPKEPIEEALYLLMVSCAKTQNRRVEEVSLQPQAIQKDPLVAQRPGDAYSSRASWQEILDPHGWLELRKSRGVTIWQRPGKDERDLGGSATSGFCSNEASGDLLYVFSSNAPPFESGRCYSKFTAKAMLDHAGDFRMLAKALAREGYGGIEARPEAIEAALHTCRAAEGRRFPEGHLEALRANDPTFAKTYARHRKDFEGATAEVVDQRYLLALVRCGIGARFSEEGVVRLVWQHYEDNRLDPQLSLSCQDVVTAMGDVLSRCGLDDTKVIAEVESQTVLEEAKEAGSNEPVIQELRKRLGFPISGMVQSEVGQGRYTLELEDGREVVLGGVHVVMTSRDFAERVYEHLGLLVPASTRKPMGWEVVVTLLARLRVVADKETTRISQTRDFLIDYTSGHLENEDWKEAVRQNDPFVRDGDLHIHPPSFRRWLRMYHGDRFSASEVREMLRSVGFVARGVSVRFGEEVVTRRVFQGPCNRLTPMARKKYAPEK